jgi:hypothetical protein
VSDEQWVLTLIIQEIKPLTSFNKYKAVSVPYCMTLKLLVAIDAKVINQEVFCAVFLAVVLAPSSACVMEPFTIFGKVGATFFAPVSIALTFGASPRFLSHFTYPNFLACNIDHF